MTRAWLVVLGSYIAAGIAALAVLVMLDGRGWHPLVEVLVADVIATFVVFGASMMVNNSSVYDPYWSVAPIAIAMWFASDLDAMASAGRQLLVAIVTLLWGIRLTYNWARHWRGLAHEDWRYVDLRQKTGVWYWPVSFGGIHLFPTVMTFLGCVPLWYALTRGDNAFGWLDGVALLVTLAAIAIEAKADQQLHQFTSTARPAGAILDTGLWAWSRHPNYFGEILFWWGLALFGLAAEPSAWWQLAGATAITLMFVSVSLPMIERRMRERRTGWAEHARRVPLLIPRPPRR